MDTAHLRLLGVPVVEHAGTSRTLQLSTPTSLLFYLALRGDWVTRSELAYLYRPDESESEALTYLRLQLHRAQDLPWASALEVEAQRLRWRVRTDVAAVRDAVGEGRWSEVVQLYTGDLLAGAELKEKTTYNAWLELERADLQRWYVTALRREAQRLEHGQGAFRSVGLYQRLLDLDEFDEWATAGLLRALVLAGERDQALARYDAFRSRLEAELDCHPSPELAALATSIRDGTVRPTDTAKPPREPGPVPTTRFVGRHVELADLRAMLARPECRLVTIVGLGGVGKTRVALELERTLASHYADGAYFVSLEAASDGDQALGRIAQALAVDGAAQRDALGAVLDLLAEREALLVLDNVEHLPELAGFVAEALATAPRLTVLAASRKPLRLTAEWLYDLRGLGVPRDGDAVTEQSSDAVALFVAAARRAAPRLEFTPQDLAHVATICRQVDGLPLALELAAAWVRVMPVDRVVTEIVSDAEFLQTDALDAPQRHRSITAVLDRTWEELSDAKASALMRLSVFRGGLTLEAGEAVTDAGLPILLGLVNQSLVSRDATGRLGCHPLVTQYAQRRLAQEPSDLTTALDRHAAYYIDLLRSYDPRGQGPGGAEGGHRVGRGPHAPARSLATPRSWRDLEPDTANLEQAWFRLLAHRRLDELVEVADCLLTFFNTLGLYQRGTALATESIALLAESRNADAADATLSGEVAARLECILLLALATMAREAGKLTESLEHATKALQHAERWQLGAYTATGLRYLGDAAQMTGRFDEARSAYRSAIELLEARGDIAELANTLNSLASMDATQEMFDEATAGFERCVSLFEETGDELSRAIALNNLGYIADARGDVHGASLRYEASLEAFEAIHFVRGISAVKNNLVVLYGMLGRLDEAEQVGRESLAMKEETNDRLGTIITLKNLGDLELMRGRPPAALTHFEPALATAIEIDAVPRLLQVLPSYAEALQATNRAEQAGRVLVAVVAHPLTPPSMRQKALRLAPELVHHPVIDDALLTALLPDLPFAD